MGSHMLRILSLLFTCLSAFHLLALAQESPNVIELRVVHNQKTKTPPDKITLTFKKKVLQLPVRDGKFEVPNEVAAEQDIVFSANMAGDYIEIKMGKSDFEVSGWEIVIADHTYGEDLKYAVPNGAIIPKSCLIIFDPKDADGWTRFVTDCRSKHKLKQ
jgi:hypothetical protein